ncbi:MAG TPA: hypothetical protein PLP30_06050 [Clostridia bacterium]|nr:hypothetical protein [Clostridia bacterium]HPQ46910.1 hypothetical protein [Clostridia bacterium]HRX41473.1 hypothetical protein [Clostridia bacterium]
MRIGTSSEKVNRAIAVAMEDIRINVREYKGGLLGESRPVMMAGADYDRPWTRDASINTYNFIAAYDRELARNTLVSVVEKVGDSYFIGGQYWDCVIWALGAERYLMIHDDPDFLRIAVDAVSNTLGKMESEEFSPDYGLFRGAAVYGDGVSAYPDAYGISGSDGCILGWPAANGERAAKKGYGIPMHVLSTNCVYYNAYMMVCRLTGKKEFLEKAELLKKSILKNFYHDGRLGYITGPLGNHYEQEGLGLSFGRMFGILPENVLDDVRSTAHGIACVDRTYDRYRQGDDLGRHSGTIWSFINSFYANEALKAGKKDVFINELSMLTDKAVRDGQFYEIYHPVTGMPYGGIQEPVRNGSYSRLKSCEHQLWSATGYMSMIINGIGGLQINLEFRPTNVPGIEFIEIEGFKCKRGSLDIRLDIGI